MTFNFAGIWDGNGYEHWIDVNNEQNVIWYMSNSEFWKMSTVGVGGATGYSSIFTKDVCPPMGTDWDGAGQTTLECLGDEAPTTTASSGG